MDKKALSERHQALQDELDKLREEINKTDKVEGLWKPEENELYYHITSMGTTGLDSKALRLSWKNFSGDNRCYGFGNVFKTIEAAEQEAKRRAILQKLQLYANQVNGDCKPNWKDDDQKWYYIAQSSDCSNDCFRDLFIEWAYQLVISVTYFKSEESAQQALSLFGAELKELYK